ncbi:nucleolar protein dao-5-like [Drosophila takahashii]|uniref:nucleolar protein dao-5-like n=1 Tax=Drosophila takahashii TaxID=29030 RepID=UPI001CF89F60|nr:nucleolar protein dao-5-like [Drosophila takahashii]
MEQEIVNLCSDSDSDATLPRAPSPKAAPSRDPRMRPGTGYPRRTPANAPPASESDEDDEDTRRSRRPASPRYASSPEANLGDDSDNEDDEDTRRSRRPASPRYASSPEAYLEDDSDNEDDEDTRRPRRPASPRYAPSPEAYVEDDSDGTQSDNEGATGGYDGRTGYGGVPHLFFKSTERHVVRHSHWQQLLQVQYSSCWIRMPFQPTEDPIIEFPTSPEPYPALMGPDTDDDEAAIDLTNPPEASANSQPHPSERAHSAPDAAISHPHPSERVHSAPDVAISHPHPSERVHSAPDATISHPHPSERAYSASDVALDLTLSSKDTHAALPTAGTSAVSQPHPSERALSVLDTAIGLTHAASSATLHAGVQAIPAAIRMIRAEGTYPDYDAVRYLGHSLSSDTASGKCLDWSSQSSNSDDDHGAICRRSRRRKRANPSRREKAVSAIEKESVSGLRRTLAPTPRSWRSQMRP